MHARHVKFVHLSFAFFLAFCSAPSVAAEELRVLVPRAIASVLGNVGAQFERATGCKLIVTSDDAAGLVRRANSGESFDVIAVTPAQIDSLIKNGKIVADTRTRLMRTGIGVEVRTGALKPDVSSVDTFKRALLSAKSIGYLKGGLSGPYVAGLLDRLGIAEAIKSKVVRPETDIVSELVAKGEVEIGMVVITQIMTTQGVEFVGPLPSEIQSYISLVGGVAADSHAPDTARELIKFLTGPIAAPAIKAQGMEQG
jgi:molybdate transport system substrate-binding protein